MSNKIKKKIRFSGNFLIMNILILFFCSCISSPDAKYNIANKYKEIIKKYNLQKYDKDDFENAEKNYNEAKKYMESKKNSKADKSLTEANKNYKAVLDKGFPLCTEEKNKEVDEIKKNAEDIKANVAVKDQFTDAESTLKEAIKNKEQKDYEKAIELLELAKQKFDQVYKDASFKKEKVEKSIDSTEKIKMEIDKNAEELDRELKELNQ